MGSHFIARALYIDLQHLGLYHELWHKKDKVPPEWFWILGDSKVHIVVRSKVTSNTVQIWRQFFFLGPEDLKYLSNRPGNAKNGISIKFYIDLVVQKISKLFFFDDKKWFWKSKKYFLGNFIFYNVKSKFPVKKNCGLKNIFSNKTLQQIPKIQYGNIYNWYCFQYLEL